VAAGEYSWSLADSARLIAADAWTAYSSTSPRCGGITGSSPRRPSPPAPAWTSLALCAEPARARWCAVPNLRHIRYFHDHQRIERMFFDGVMDLAAVMLRPDPGPSRAGDGAAHGGWPSLYRRVEGAGQADPQDAAASRGQMFIRRPEGTNPSSVGPLRTEAVMTIAAATTPAVALIERDDSDLLALIRADDEDDELRAAAREVIVIRYESLVRGCVHRYRDSPEPVEDLMQAGYVGLLKAINNFDPALGQNLAAYAQPCVSGEIKRHFRDKRWQIHVKRSAQELLLQVRRARGELAQDLGRSPRDEEMARHLGVSLDDLHDAQRADMVFHSHSLDAPLYGQEDPATLSELIGQEDPQVEHTLDMESVLTHWSDLPEREQRILTMRFYGNMTQAEIGERLGISQMHVSRLLARALRYLRDRLLENDEEETAARQGDSQP
jgi:RNA polymerase sigma-B factor